MSFGRALLLALALAAGTASADDAKPRLSDAQIRKLLITASREGYGGSCPCPYDIDRAGRTCGKRSAYNRAGGEAPLCFDADVSDAMVASYRSAHEAPDVER